MAVPMAFKIQLTDCVVVVKQVKIAITLPFLEGPFAMVEYSCRRIEHCSTLFSGNMAPLHNTYAAVQHMCDWILAEYTMNGCASNFKFI